MGGGAEPGAIPENMNGKPEEWKEGDIFNRDSWCPGLRFLLQWEGWTSGMIPSETCAQCQGPVTAQSRRAASIPAQTQAVPGVGHPQAGSGWGSGPQAPRYRESGEVYVSIAPTKANGHTVIRRPPRPPPAHIHHEPFPQLDGEKQIHPP